MRPPAVPPERRGERARTGNADAGALSRFRTVAARGAQTHPRKEPWRLEDVRRIPGLLGLGKGLLGLGKKHGAVAVDDASAMALTVNESLSKTVAQREPMNEPLGRVVEPVTSFDAVQCPSPAGYVTACTS
jgi:hypothetical protein